MFNENKKALNITIRQIMNTKRADLSVSSKLISALPGHPDIVNENISYAYAIRQKSEQALKQDSYLVALLAVEESIRINPTDIWAHRLYRSVVGAANKHLTKTGWSAPENLEVTQLYEALYATGELGTESHVLAILSYYETHQYVKAKEVYERVKKIYPNYSILNDLGKLFEDSAESTPSVSMSLPFDGKKMLEHEELFASLSSFIESNPALVADTATHHLKNEKINVYNDSIYFMLAIAKDNTGDLFGAYEDFTALRKFSPQCDDYARSCDIILEKLVTKCGSLEFEPKNYQKIKTYSDFLMSVHFLPYHLYAQRMNIHLEENEIDIAIEGYENLIALSPNDIDYLNLAFEAYTKRGLSLQAEKMADRIRDVLTKQPYKLNGYKNDVSKQSKKAA